MTSPRILFGTLLAVGAIAFGSTEAKAQYLPPQYFAPGYGAYYRTYPTYNGGVVNRTSYTTPYGTTFSRQYYNPYSGYNSNSSSYQSFGQSFNNYNAGYISPALTPYYSGPGYGNYVQPGFGFRVR
jgi:hypothetical protein